MAQKVFSLQEVFSQTNALDEVTADPVSEDDSDGKWWDMDGMLNLHGGDVGCVHDIQSLLLQSDDVVAGPSGIQQLAENVNSVEDTHSQSSILCQVYNVKQRR